jgi:hypothetical protein
MKAQIDAFLSRVGSADAVAMYERGDIANADKVQDLQKRFCFDVMKCAQLTPFVCKEIYPYADDTHLYTALKAICPTVTRKY